ncbi:hypothetical protein [Deinococcus fonticola]|uniref:hypothetical protein n=1 Tax=Deinococcus fonticola TaxID=2528713 RepID=UPI0010754B50|nr:hypothetical protein [Deinococcus fonticola]
METQLALLELYEYKVTDLTQGRQPLGGRRSLLELRDELRQADLDAALTRRFARVDRLFRDSKRRAPVEASLHTPEQQVEEVREPFTASHRVRQTESPEAAAWQELQQLVWFSRLQERVQALVLAARREAGHATLRVIYAVTETAERALRGVTEAFAVPLADDRLLSLDDREIAVQLGEALCHLLLTREGELAVLDALSLTRAQPFPPHADEALLAARIEAVEREPLSPAARDDLIRALRQQYPQTPGPRERPAVRLACARLEHVLEAELQGRPRLTEVPPGSVLYSDDPRTELTDPPQEQDELVIFLGGAGQETYWHDLHLRWQRVGQDWHLMLDKQLVLLRPSLTAAQRHLKVRLNQEILWLYHTGDYLLLRHTASPQQTLRQLAQQAHLTAQLLDPAQTYANLRLGRAVSRALRDMPVDPQEFWPASAAKYSGVDAAELLAFARQGAATLLTLAEQRRAGDVQELMNDLAPLLHVPQPHVLVLQRALEDVQVVTQTNAEVSAYPLVVPTGGHFKAVKLREQPLNLQCSGRVVTLSRDYKGDVAVLLPGGPSGEKAVLTDLLVVAVGDLSLVLVKWQGWVAAMTIPQLPARG